MMQTEGAPLGRGSIHPAGSVEDADLMQTVQTYRRRVTSAYRSVRPEEIGVAITGSPYAVSPKIDGELWFLVFDGSSNCCLISSTGRAITGAVPLLDEVRSLAPKFSSRVVIAGELFAASTTKSRPRVGDVSAALSGGAQASVEKLGFMAFDVVEGLLGAPPLTRPDGERYEALDGLLGKGKRVKPVRTDNAESASELPALFAELVEGGKAEGLIIRSAHGTIYKVKPEFSIDCVVMGFTRRSDGPHTVRSLLLGLTREDGQIQVLGSCGNLGAESDRRDIADQLSKIICDSDFRFPSSSGDLYTFVEPRIVAEIRVTDLQSESSDGRQIRSMVLSHHDSAGWKTISQMPIASCLHPVLVGIRNDKKPGIVDTRISQILERCILLDASAPTKVVQLPKSTVLKRRVWQKITKGKTSVRKLVIWKTNKESESPNYPAFVIHWTDYSAGRGTPLEREVRLAPDASIAEQISNNLIDENIKKGWEEVL
jgi:hypothetical protein